MASYPCLPASPLFSSRGRSADPRHLTPSSNLDASPSFKTRKIYKLISLSQFFIVLFVFCAIFPFISSNYGIIKAQASASRHCACPIRTLRSPRNSSNIGSRHLLSRQASKYTSRILPLMDLFAEIHQDIDGFARTRRRAGTEPEAISVHGE